MDPILLHTFQVVCDKATTLAAAQALGVSQSAVSRRLAQMEAALGVPLFWREHGRLVPTPENRALRGQISAVLTQSLRLAALAREMASDETATRMLKVAFPASLTLTIVPEIIEDFTTTHPHVQVELHTGTYDLIEHMLQDNRAEVGFLRMPTRRPGLLTTPLIEVPTVCVLPEAHPLTAEPEIRAAQLAGQPLILLGKARQPRREIDLMFMAAGIVPQIRVEAHSVMSACALAARGLGITIVNGLMARDYAHLPIAIRSLRERLPHHFAFAMPATIPPSDAAKDFMRTASRHFALVPGVRTPGAG